MLVVSSEQGSLFSVPFWFLRPWVRQVFIARRHCRSWAFSSNDSTLAVCTDLCSEGWHMSSNLSCLQATQGSGGWTAELVTGLHAFAGFCTVLYPCVDHVQVKCIFPCLSTHQPGNNHLPHLCSPRLLHMIWTQTCLREYIYPPI